MSCCHKIEQIEGNPFPLKLPLNAKIRPPLSARIQFNVNNNIKYSFKFYLLQEREQERIKREIEKAEAEKQKLNND